MVVGYLLNSSSTAETKEFQDHAINIVQLAPELEGKVFHYGHGTVRGLMIRAENCAEVQRIAEVIMSTIPFPRRLAGDYGLSFEFSTSNVS
ncbi:TPA: hypothetical protein DD449_01270 [Candidatus Berkelbacteria bacterium]|uniref:Uncharacterized protein n=1 Tax=Berkelbacteria bacterium GW2011_GWE1_39_12 TaxID=1618337 RepID=A0A0G4B3S9_9BACT|nr:MAG: hypothetical protein UT28_C0001G0833 [Berkelbacteria bacterium GW2011_GWE1_39_12]HBO60301.1 hypothetical protein [Candidatus Berkelbacteria bacterium]